MCASKSILKDSLNNKGNAFSQEERDKYQLQGFIPAKVESEADQVARIEMQLAHLTSDLQKYIYLSNLQDINETLYYHILMSDPVTYLPIVYDPTVGEACLKFGHIYRQGRGLYISLEHKGQIEGILKNWSIQDVRFIVVTDGGRILGLGDLGVNGMGIPIGKLALYTVIGGVPPQYQLPICLDVGTNNVNLLNDPLYLGLRKPRADYEQYQEFLDEFVHAVNKVFPTCCIQFEDFTNYQAINSLERYREKMCMFNDDIQGTASVTVAMLYSAFRYLKTSMKDQTILFLGAGSAAHGIANLLVYAMEKEGLKKEEGQKKCWMFDTKGLVVKSRPRLESFKAVYAHDHAPIDSFLECISVIKPTVIIGVSTTPGLFTREVIEKMAEINATPLIIPLSNPTSQEECTAHDAYVYSQGRALFAAGVQFDPVTLGDITYYPAQANNLWIFPAIGMAVFATGASRVTDEMFLVAAQTLARQLSADEIDKRMLFPNQNNIISISVNIAAAVAQVIFDNNLASVERPAYDSHIKFLIQKLSYHPFYKDIEN